LLYPLESSQRPMRGGKSFVWVCSFFFKQKKWRSWDMPLINYKRIQVTLVHVKVRWLLKLRHFGVKIFSAANHWFNRKTNWTNGLPLNYHIH
jgi:hypothetical protein